MGIRNPCVQRAYELSSMLQLMTWCKIVYTYRNQQFWVWYQFHHLPVREHFSFIISKYALPQPSIYFYVFLLTVISDTRDGGEIYKNLVHPINARWEKLSTNYCNLQTTHPYGKGRKLSPLMPSNEVMFTSNWHQWRFFMNPY